MPAATIAAAVEQRGAVGERDRRRPVHDDERGAVGEDRAQRVLDERLGVHVERRQRVVEHEHARAADDRAREREPLPLPARERQALLADPRVEPPRQVVARTTPARPRARPSMSASVASGCPISRFSRTLAENSVGSSNANPTCAAQAAQREVAHVVAVERDPPAGRVVEPREQRRERRLARTGRADERERLAGMDREVDAAQHGAGRCPGYAKRTSSNRTSPRACTSVARVRAVGDDRLGVEHLPDAARRGLGLLRPSRGSSRAPRSGTRGSARTTRTRRGRRRSGCRPTTASAPASSTAASVRFGIRPSTQMNCVWSRTRSSCGVAELAGTARRSARTSRRPGRTP